MGQTWEEIDEDSRWVAKFSMVWTIISVIIILIPPIYYLLIKS